ncbi:MAG: FtsX-like permease family protein [Bryobacteraceae bacterium]
MVYRLVFENLKHRPVRTFLSAFLIGVQVTLILTLVGLTDGMLGNLSESRRGTGADIMMRPTNGSLLSFSATMDEKIVNVVRKVPHVAIATGTLIHQVDTFGTSIAGIHLDEFNAMSGGFTFLSGGLFQRPGELIVDDVYARSKHVHVGDKVDLGGDWTVVGIVASGKLSRTFADIKEVQERYSSPGLVSVIWVKLDNPANTEAVIDSLKQRGFAEYKIDSMEQYLSLLTPDAIPLLRPFTRVVIGVGVFVGFLAVFLSMYTAVLERTREIGILKALGASPMYILAMLMRETVLLALAGTVAGILMSYGSQWLLRELEPTLTMSIVYAWWPGAAAVALTGSLIGALYPGLKAARQDAIEALSYD